MSNEMANLLELIQRRSTLIITSGYKCTKHEELLKELGLTPLSKRRTYFKLVLFFKTKNQIAPAYLSDLCPAPVADRTNYNLRNAENTDPLISTKNYFLKSFLPSTIKFEMNFLKNLERLEL